MKPLFIGMKEFPTKKVILITTPELFDVAKKTSSKLAEFTVPSEIKQIKGNPLESVFEIFADICQIYPNDQLIVNVGAGDHTTTCASISASYANGLKAFDVAGEMIVLLPIMKLSYYNEITPIKMKILNELNKEEYQSLNDVAKKLKMSISLLSYHINGTDKYKGLKYHRLVDTKSVNKNLYIKLSSMGKLLLKGYVNKNNK